jgi:ribonuclease D
MQREINASEIVLIQDPRSLSNLIKTIQESRISHLAMDLEGENNLHRYGIHLCLIQLSLNAKTYIVDPIEIENITPLKDVFESEIVEKVIYAAEEDVKMLKHSCGINLRTIFDVQIAAKILGIKEISLSLLVQDILGIPFEKISKLQKSNWNIRPLSNKQILYAAKDVAYLVQLKYILEKQLIKRGLRDDFRQKCRGLEQKEFRLSEKRYLKLKYVRRLSNKEIIFLKHLYHARDEIARQLDFPPFWVIQNALLVKLAQRPPQSDAEWKRHNGLSRKAIPYIKYFSQAVKSAKDELDRLR